MSNERSCSDGTFSGLCCSLDTGGGGGSFCAPRGSAHVEGAGGPESCMERPEHAPSTREEVCPSAPTLAGSGGRHVTIHQREATRGWGGRIEKARPPLARGHSKCVPADPSGFPPEHARMLVHGCVCVWVGGWVCSLAVSVRRHTKVLADGQG